MKKILLVAYYFYPYNNIAYKRLYFFAQTLIKEGYDVTVLTRQYEGNEKSSTDINKDSNTNEPKEFIHDGIKVVAAPNKNTLYYALSKNETRFQKNILRIYLFITNLFGILQPEANNNPNFKREIKSLFKKSTFDFVLVSSPPSNLVRLAAWIYKQYKVPTIIDFRDYFYTNKLRKNISLSFVQSLFYTMLNRHVTNSLRDIKSKKITVASGTIGDLLGVDYTLILNGFDENERISHSGNRKFEISYTGTIYPIDNYQFIIDGYSQFIKLVTNPDDIRFNFIGTDNKEFEQYIQTIKHHELYTIQNKRIPQDEMKKIIAKTSILLSIGWVGWNGIYTGKFFEYLGYKKNILLAPNDQDVLEELLTKTQAGKFANTPSEMADILFQWYKEWKSEGVVTYHGIPEVVQQYSRQHQNQRLVRLLQSNF